MSKPPLIASYVCGRRLFRHAGISAWPATRDDATTAVALTFSRFALAWPRVYSNLSGAELAVQVAKDADGKILLLVRSKSPGDQIFSQIAKLLKQLNEPRAGKERFYVDEGFLAERSVAAAYGPTRETLWFGGRPRPAGSMIAMTAGSIALAGVALFAGISWASGGNENARSAGNATTETSNPSSSAGGDPAATTSAPVKTGSKITVALVRSILAKQSISLGRDFDVDNALDGLVANHLNYLPAQTTNLGGVIRLKLHILGLKPDIVANYVLVSDKWRLKDVGPE